METVKNITCEIRMRAGAFPAKSGLDEYFNQLADRIDKAHEGEMLETAKCAFELQRECDRAKRALTPVLAIIWKKHKTANGVIDMYVGNPAGACFEAKKIWKEEK